MAQEAQEKKVEPYAVLIVRSYPRSHSASVTIPKQVLESFQISSGDRLACYLDFEKQEITFKKTNALPNRLRQVAPVSIRMSEA
jgi:hypothetical protein